MSGAVAYGCDKLGSDEERQAAGGERQRILAEFFETGRISIPNMNG